MQTVGSWAYHVGAVIGFIAAKFRLGFRSYYRRKDLAPDWED